MKDLFNGNAKVTVGKHLLLAGMSGSSHVCDAFRSAEENEGIGGLHKQGGKVTPGC